MLGCRGVGCGEQHVGVDEEHPTSDAFGELFRCEIGPFLVDVERISPPRRADPDETEPMLGGFGGEGVGELCDELVEGDPATRCFGLEAGLGLGGKIERHGHVVDCRGHR